MRISDWSSDVCSSDLRAGDRQRERTHRAIDRETDMSEHQPVELAQIVLARRFHFREHVLVATDRALTVDHQVARQDVRAFDRDRSEEHTSELQSLMRISYAVFCLKKKKKYTQYSTARS